MSKTYLGVDIGGTAVKLGLVDENGRVLRRAERSVSFDGYKTPILDTVQAAIHEFLTADAPRLEGIAVSATGQIDSRRGVVAGTCGNFPGWTLKVRWSVPSACPSPSPTTPTVCCWARSGPVRLRAIPMSSV